MSSETGRRQAGLPHGAVEGALGAEEASTPRFAALHHRNFQLFWTGHLVHAVTEWMQITATGWLILQLTDSPAALGINAAFQAVPLIVFALVGGVIADRFDRYRLIVRAQVVRIPFDVAIAVLVATGLVRVEYIYAHSFITATILGLSTPARQALLPSLVPKRAFLSAIALNSVVWNGSAILGPSLAGVIIGLWAIEVNFYAAVLGVVFYLVTLLLIRLDRPALAERLSDNRIWQGLTEGFRYAWHETSVGLVLLAALVLGMLGRSYNYFFPVFARDIYQVGPQGLGAMAAMPAVGTILAGIWLSAMAGKVSQERWFLASTAVLALGLIAFASSPFFWLALPLLVLVGMASAVATSLAHSLLQHAVDDRVRGRVMSFNMAATWGGNRLGAVPIGLLGAVWGVPLVVALTGALLLLLPAALLRNEVFRR